MNSADSTVTDTPTGTHFGDPMIAIRGLTRCFGTMLALDHVSLDVPRGVMLGLLGPSGSGKTTLLRLLAGLDRPDSGTIHLNGQDATALPPRQRGIGFVFQNYALFRHMTVTDNIAFGLRVLPWRQRPSRAARLARAEELLEFVQLSGLGQRYPTQLSGGQCQRVALARALATRPNLMLLDEPFGALDARVRQDLRRWLRSLHEAMGLTAVFVTHDQDEALEVADLVAVMNQGRIEQIGTPQDIYDNPASPFVYQFLGQVNALRGQAHGPQAGILGLTLPCDPPQHGPVTAFVRPHDVEVRPITGEGIVATVRHLVVLGPQVRVTAMVGSTALEASMTRAALEKLRLDIGTSVRLWFHKVRFFPV